MVYTLAFNLKHFQPTGTARKSFLHPYLHTDE